MNQNRFGFDAYLDFLRSFRTSGEGYFLAGGQAVNFWAEFIDSRFPSQSLNAFRPFTSKDCDIWINHSAWKHIKRSPGGKLRESTSPADGQLAILTLNDDPPRVVDLMTTVYGIPSTDLPRMLKRVVDDGNIKVIDPIYLFRSKCHCLHGLDQSDRQDARHVRMLALILPEYLSFLIEEATAERLGERDILKEIKLLKKILGTHACRNALEQLELDSHSLIPWDKMAACGLETLATFASTQRNPRRDND